MAYNPRTNAHTPLRHMGQHEAEAAIRAAIVFRGESFPPKVPLAVSLRFVVTRPPSVPKKRLLPVVKPDLDNYVKLVLDACNGYLWPDDSQVCRVTAEKTYSQSPISSPPKIELKVEAIL